MSQQLGSVSIIEFDAQVKAAYQASGMLRPAVRVKTGVVGSSTRFRRYNRGIATPRAPQTDVRPMNAGYGEATATIADWNAAEYTDVFDQQRTNIEERGVVAVNIAAAIGRREDQMVLDALDAANASASIDTNLGGAASGVNLAKIRRANALLNRRAVPRTDRYFLGSATGEEQLLGTTEATSADFNTVKALVDGEMKKFVNFHFLWLDDRDEGGLPIAATIRTNYAFHKDGIGLAIGIDRRTEVNYIPEKTSWLANGLFSAGAVAIDPLGIVEIATTEA
jgi:hypothetical protein